MRYGLLSAVAATVLSLSVTAFAQSTQGGASGSAGAGGGAGASGAGGGISGGASTGGAMGGAPGASSRSRSGAGATSGTSGGMTSGGSGAAGSGAPAGAASSASSAGISLSSQQRTQITRSFTSVNVRPLASVNFAISIGAVIPATVELYEVPTEVVRVVPEYRGYRYFVVGNQIVIVEPSARRIIAVLQRTG
jgi:uncharacterized protein DUF1236